MNHEHEQNHATSSATASLQNDTVEPGQSSRSALLRKPEHAVPSGLVRRRMRDANGVADGADHAVTVASSSIGSPLPDTLMRKFETSLGVDLSGVRVHTGGASERAAESVGAKAYTVGNDIHFRAGHYDPLTFHGQQLLAHEIVHTVQQSGGVQRVQFKLEVSPPGDGLEHEADSAAHSMVSGAPAIVSAATGISPHALQRRAATEGEAAELERLDNAENAAYKAFGKLSNAAQAWDYLASASGPVRQAAFAKLSRTRLSAAIARAGEGEDVFLVDSMGTLDTPAGPVERYPEYKTASERQFERQLQVGADVTGGVLGATGYLIAGDKGADLGATGDLLLSCTSPHPLNSQEVVNAPRTESYMHRAPTHVTTSPRSTTRVTVATEGVPSGEQRHLGLDTRYDPETARSIKPPLPAGEHKLEVRRNTTQAQIEPVSVAPAAAVPGEALPAATTVSDAAAAAPPELVTPAATASATASIEAEGAAATSQELAASAKSVHDAAQEVDRLSRQIWELNAELVYYRNEAQKAKAMASTTPLKLEAKNARQVVRDAQAKLEGLFREFAKAKKDETIARREACTNAESLQRQARLRSEIAQWERELAEVAKENYYNVAQGAKASNLKSYIQSSKELLGAELEAGPIYARLRASSPGTGAKYATALESAFQNLPPEWRTPDGSFMDVTTGKFVPRDQASPDHIWALRDVAGVEGLELMRPALQALVAELPKNYFPLTQAAQSSKGARTMLEWFETPIGSGVQRDFRAVLLDLERNAKENVKRAIKDPDSLLQMAK
jgi:hypothetical protein